MSDTEKLARRLEEYIVNLDGGVCVAFSGGVDSSVVAKAAVNALKGRGRDTFAVTVKSPLGSREDLEISEKFAAERGIHRHVLEVDPLKNEAVAENSRERCYHCKKMMFEGIIRFCGEKGRYVLLDGTNYDDTKKYRPGMAAAAELGVISPLKELGFTKADIVELARFYRLSVSNRPASPCMATRIPYGEPLRGGVLGRISDGEAFLKSFVMGSVRLRLHGKVLRIEVEPQDMAVLLEKRDEVVSKFKDLGFVYITLDLEGFRSGSMDI